MAYNKLINCATLSAFNTGLDDGIINESSIVFIEDIKNIWTHGVFYPCPYTKEEIDNLIFNSSVKPEDIEELRSELTKFKATKGQANGLASLDENGKIPASQLSGELGRVVGLEKFLNTQSELNTDPSASSSKEGDKFYCKDVKLIFSKLSDGWDEGSTPKDNTIYNHRLEDSTGRTNVLYRWDGSTMVEISASIALGETPGTAYEGSKGKSTTDKVNSHVSNKSNPHGVTLSQVATVSNSGSGNAVTDITISGGKLTVTKGSTFNNYSLPLSSSSTRGGIKIGYTENGKNYPVELSEEKAFVNVPWTDTHYTTHMYAGDGSASDTSTTNGNTKISIYDNTSLRDSITIKGSGAASVSSDDTGVITINSINTTYSVATTSSNGLMSSSDKSKLDKIESGAQVNDVTSVAGKTGAVTLTKSDVGLGNVTNESKATMFTNAALTGTPTAPTAGSGTNTTQIATTAFVQSAINSKIAASDAMIYKGTIGSTGSTITALPTSYKTGWTYKVSTAGTYAGQKCEVGDMIIALVDRSGSGNTNSDWTVIQSNIDGAVTGPASSVDSRVAVFSGSTGKVIKDSGFTIAKSVPSNAKFTDTVYTHPTSSGNKHIPSGGSSGQILRWSSDGTAVWGNDNNTTYSQATSSTLGLVKIGYTESGKNYPVELNSSGQMYVNVPWTDTNTTYSLVGAKDSTGLVKNGSSVTSSSGYTACPIIGGIPYYKDTNTTYTLSSFGITATASELNKLDGCTATVTELNYLDGVTSNIQTQLNGKAASSHSHPISQISDLNSGWDSLLKNAPSGYVTRWPSWSEVTSKPSTFTPSSHNHQYFSGWSDTRNVVETPNDFNSKFRILGIKSLSKLGISGAEGSYAQVIGYRGWAESSGGKAWKIAFCDNAMFVNKGSTTTWDGWQKVYTSGSKPTPSEIGAAASSHTHDNRYYTESEINTKLNSKANTNQNMYIGTTAVPINRASAALTLNGVNISGNAGSATYVSRERNTNTVTTLTSIPTSKALVIANLSKATTISVASGMQVGDSITVICNPTASFTQPIPTSGSYKSMDGDSLTVKSGKPFEINIVCYASGKYSISCKVAK